LRNWYQNRNNPGITNPSTSGIVNPSTLDISNPPTSGIANPSNVDISNPPTSGIVNPSTSGIFGFEYTATTAQDSAGLNLDQGQVQNGSGATVPTNDVSVSGVEANFPEMQNSKLPDSENVKTPGENREEQCETTAFI
jgi:hypothetical protein